MAPNRKVMAAAGVCALGVVGILIAHWMIFFWVPTEARQGIIQRIFYIHVPAAWIAELAFGITALASAVYLWTTARMLWPFPQPRVGSTSASCS